MASKEIVNKWMSEADDDFLYAEASLREGLDFFSKICFHFQQAAEKYLKTYIVARDLEFLKIHDLTELLKICTGHDAAFSMLKEDCIFLNPFYIETRYPVHWPMHYTKEVAMQAKDAAENAGKFVRQKLPG